MGLNPYTHDSSESRAFQLCECQHCHVIQTCTPEHDFFSQSPNGPLFCEQCIIILSSKEQVMTIERKIQQAGSVSLPRGYQQPGRAITIEVKDDNTLILKFEPIANSTSSSNVSVNVYLVCVKEGSREPRVRAQLRAIDETGHVICRWDSSLAKYGFNNFHENYKNDDVVKAITEYFPGKTPNVINAITDETIALPEIVRVKIDQIKERIKVGKTDDDTKA